MKNKFFVKMSRHSYTLLKYQVDFNQLTLIMHIMNLNIYFQISSEADLVLDSRVHESILLHDGDAIETVAGADAAAGGDAPSQMPNALSTGEQQALALGRLKQFYLDTADPVGAAAGQATGTGGATQAAGGA